MNVLGEGRLDCRQGQKFGWRCSRVTGHPGPCALWPKLWAHPILYFKFVLFR